MTSPLPGMAPHLEARWDGVHFRMVLNRSNVLRGGMPGSFPPPNPADAEWAVQLLEARFQKSRASADAPALSLGDNLVQIEQQVGDDGPSRKFGVLRRIAVLLV